jgi:hypothetical protein
MGYIIRLIRSVLWEGRLKRYDLAVVVMTHEDQYIKALGDQCSRPRKILCIYSSGRARGLNNALNFHISQMQPFHLSYR